MSWLEPVLVIGAIVCLGLLVTWLFQRSLDQPGGREGLGTGGNGLGMIDAIFSPSRGDANEELQRQKKVGAVLPAADGDPPRGQVEFDADGRMRRITLARPDIAPAAEPGAPDA